VKLVKPDEMAIIEAILKLEAPGNLITAGDPMKTD
jgi:hypothetical protein